MHWFILSAVLAALVAYAYIQPYFDRRWGFAMRAAGKQYLAYRLHERFPFLRMGCSVALALLFLVLAPALQAQFTLPDAPTPTGTVTNFYMGGAFYSPSSTPATAGVATYGHLIGGTGTYGLAVMTAIPGPNRTIVSNVGAGVAQKVVTVAGFDIYGLTNAGLAWTGNAAGYQVGGGFSLVHKFVPYKDGFFGVVPTVTFNHNNLASGSVQVGGGLQFGWFQTQQ